MFNWVESIDPANYAVENLPSNKHYLILLQKEHQLQGCQLTMFFFAGWGELNAIAQYLQPWEPTFPSFLVGWFTHICRAWNLHVSMGCWGPKEYAIHIWQGLRKTLCDSMISSFASYFLRCAISEESPSNLTNLFSSSNGISTRVIPLNMVIVEVENPSRNENILKFE